MVYHMNPFRVLADVSHTLSKCILIWAIHANKSAEGMNLTINSKSRMKILTIEPGVSLITQALYVIVFCLRYLDLFLPDDLDRLERWWNFILKIFYITSSFYIIFIMMKIYARTREREKAWKFGAYCLGGSVVLGPIVAALSEGKSTTFLEVLRNTSLVLESVCVLPQLLLLRQTTVPTVINTGYILTLGSYRAFYILNWLVRLVKEHHFEWPAFLFGIIQTAFYVDFAWVYWTRQRVKLRNGAVVDSDDLSRGFLVSRFLGRGDAGNDEEAVNGTDGSGSKPRGRWGRRGISVSADEGVADAEAANARKDARVDTKDALSQDENNAILKDPDDYEDGLSGLDHDADHRAASHSRGQQ